ncbi:hypothetical protein OGZ01_30515 (plasmid) [Vibrio harveyi]|nr:hypothetical protein [Vibrio harveyi]
MVDTEQPYIGGEDFHWAPALIERSGMLKLAPAGESLGYAYQCNEQFGLFRCGGWSGHKLRSSTSKINSNPNGWR